jgi:hypothetical protein
MEIQDLGNPDRLEGVRQIASAFFDAWNRRSVRDIGPLFLEDADVVNSPPR